MSPYTLIAIAGPKRSGKTTLAHGLADKRNSVYVLSFAAPIKDILIGPLKVPYSLVYGNEHDRNQMTDYGVTVRQLMQQVGGHLRQVDPGIWVKLMAKRVEDIVASWPHENTLIKSAPGIDDSPWIVIDDMRHQNEYDWAIGMDGVVLKLTHQSEDDDPHSSEHGLENGLGEDHHNYDAMYDRSLNAAECADAVFLMVRSYERGKRGN